MSDSDSDERKDQIMHDLLVREYWANAYKDKTNNPIYGISSLDLNNHSDSNKLPYEPTAVLTSQNQRRPITFRDLLDLDLRND